MMELVYVAITGLFRVVASAVTSLVSRLGGWTGRALKMIEVYERLPRDRYQTARDDFVMLLLRGKIYELVANGLGYRFTDDVLEGKPNRIHLIKSLAITATGSFAFGMVAFGIPNSAMEWLARLIGMALGLALGELIVRALYRWPKREWNAFYMSERSRKEHLDMMRKVFDILDRGMMRASTERSTGDAGGRREHGRDEV